MDDAGLAAAAAALLVLGAAFQVVLAAGAPLGAVAYGGRAALDDGRLPVRHRVTSAVAAIVLFSVAGLVLVAGDLLPVALPGGVTHVGLWVLAGLFALNTAGNLSARHPAERWGAGAVTACLSVLLVLLAT